MYQFKVGEDIAKTDDPTYKRKKVGLLGDATSTINMYGIFLQFEQMKEIWKRIMIKLRVLKKKDAPFMLEWMHDEEILRNFRFDANAQTIESVEDFIKNAEKDKKNYHFAIVDETDTYQGTISLKNIDCDNQKAEYAICLRKCAQGKNIAQQSTEKILEYGFNALKLNRIYLNVLSKNSQAIHFYQKFGFKYEGETKEDVIIRDNTESLKWFRLLKREYKELLRNRNTQ